MYTDPVLDEIREYRDNVAANFNYDVKAMIEDLRRRQKESGKPMVSRKPKCVPAATDTDPNSIAKTLP
ncbi:hypothetical protein [Bythopirellula goksoeyrii]|uniref:Uncharacterized protein n=1 Tax=Bythopirellula goksoeyrii TaxID=1400387 RepID=A0A5B9QIU7_9BACT|nr:hypothetical protein [Bythopirellula goksoeyrii]QEG37929.1 hypothetical protein Pr1d_52770 [Bythopirellula goksoeyrii]